MVTLLKGLVWDSITLSQHLALLGVHIFSAVGGIYFTCDVTPQDYYIEVSCIFKSFWQPVTMLKILVAIGILIIKRKKASAKNDSNKYVLPQKN